MYRPPSSPTRIAAFVPPGAAEASSVRFNQHGAPRQRSLGPDPQHSPFASSDGQMQVQFPAAKPGSHFFGIIVPDGLSGQDRNQMSDLPLRKSNLPAQPHACQFPSECFQ